MVRTESRTVTGVCPVHGTVNTTKDVPRPGWPFIVYGIRRAKAAIAPAYCPQCGTKLGKG